MTCQAPIQASVLEDQATAPIRSYLKWAGSKTRLIQEIIPLIPHGAKRFVEPFMGSGVVALNVAPRFRSLFLSDFNQDLVECHRRVIASDEFIKQVKGLFAEQNNTAEAYAMLRAEFNATKDQDRKAALFLYLNRHCFNGLCRYSSKGVFNTPFGKIAKPYFPEREFALFQERLQKSVIKHCDFKEVLSFGRAGDFIYCDPPYAPLTDTANFSAYAAGGFGIEEQKTLATLAARAAKKGATVAISNHDTPFTRELYKDASTIKSLMVSRTISCDGATRAKVPELIAVYSPKVGSK